MSWLPIPSTTEDDGSATPGDDYTAPDGTLTIGSGILSGTIEIETRTDRVLKENDESLVVTLTGATTATRTVTVDDTATATTTINDTTKATVTIRPPTSSTASRTATSMRSAILHQADRRAAGTTRATSLVVCDDCFAEGSSLDIPPQLEDGSGNPVSMPDGETFTVDYMTKNGTATAGDDYGATQGSLTITGKGDNEPVEADPITLTILDDELNEAVETFTVTLMSDNLPAGVDLGEAATVKIADDDPLTATVRANTIVVYEGDSATFTVELDPGHEATADVHVDYTVTGAVSTTGTVTIEVGALTGTITIDTPDDNVPEPDETLVVTLDRDGASSAGKVNVDETPATKTIRDDDKLTAIVTEDAPSVYEGESATFTVSLSKRSTEAVRVGYSVSGSATAGDDYKAPDGTLTIAQGASRGTITIDTINDHLLEPDETLVVTLDQATSAGHGDGE